MAIRPKAAFQRQLRTVFNLGAIRELTDGQLLERFASRGGEGAELAFAALVERHGSMVLRVCRQALRDQHDAEDCFQATFLILVKQARSLWVRDSLGPWLHRVAHRVAARARRSAARIRENEQRAAAGRPDVVSEGGAWDDLAAVLHEEIDRLPERYRVPVVLCDLQGLTHERAARHLGWPVGTVKSRLARAREILGGRLTRRGLGQAEETIKCGKGLRGILALRALDTGVPGALVESTVRAATSVAAGKALAAGIISSPVVILIEEVLKTMAVTRLKIASLVVLIGAAGAAAGLAQQGSRSNASQAQGQSQGPASADSRQPGAADAAPASTPVYIAQSRALIVTRLEEEVAEARARLDRTLAKFRSPEHPAVVRASETLEALVQRLDRIDRVLVDVVETYPTMVDFSGGPPHVDHNAQPEGGLLRDTVNAGSFLRGKALDQNGATHPMDQQNWSDAKRDNAYPASKQPGSGKAGQNSFDQQGASQKDKAQQTSPRDQSSGGAQKDSAKPGQNSQGQKSGSQNKDGSQNSERDPVQNNYKQKNGSQTLDRGTEQKGQGGKDGSRYVPEVSGEVGQMLDMMSGDDVEKTYFQGAYYKKIKKVASAEYYFGKVVERWPDSPWAAKAMAELAAMRGAPSESKGGGNDTSSAGKAPDQPEANGQTKAGHSDDLDENIKDNLRVEMNGQQRQAGSPKDSPIHGQNSQGKSQDAEKENRKLDRNSPEQPRQSKPQPF